MNIKRLYLIAVVVAIVSAPFVALFDRKYPWLIAIPIISGTALVLFLEMRDDRTHRS